VLEAEVITLEDEEREDNRDECLDSLKPVGNPIILAGAESIRITPEGNLNFSSPSIDGVTNDHQMNYGSRQSQKTVNPNYQTMKTSPVKSLPNEPSELYREYQTHYLKLHYPEVASSLQLIRSVVEKQADLTSQSDANDVRWSFDDFYGKFANFMMINHDDMRDCMFSESSANDLEKKSPTKTSNDIEELVARIASSHNPDN